MSVTRNIGFKEKQSSASSVTDSVFYILKKCDLGIMMFGRTIIFLGGRFAKVISFTIEIFISESLYIKIKQ